MKRKQPDPVLMAIMSEIHKTVEKPLPGYKTIRQWAETWGYKPSRALELINKGIKFGTIQKKTFRVSMFDGKRIAPVPHYGLKKK
jgi:NOL1/NOP2/fmu family ribosome biogenesis protein